MSWQRRAVAKRNRKCDLVCCHSEVLLLVYLLLKLEFCEFNCGKLAAMLIVNDFKWSQTSDEILIQIPLGNSASKADVLTSEKFVKIHAAPYYCELFLLHSVVEEESVCQLSKHEARLRLRKAENVEWDSLERQFESKDEKLQVKQQIHREIQTRASEKSKLKIEMKEQIRRSEIENSISMDAEKRETIEKFKRSIIEMEVPKVDEIKKVESRMKTFAPATAAATSSSSISALNNDSGGTSSGNKVEQSSISIQKQEKLSERMPEIRKSAHIEIEFSRRNFVTPKRESQSFAEQEWIMKQNEARRNVIGFVEEDLLPEERDPMFLKSKGDDFFRKCNYLAAISAYSTGIRLASKCYELYLNRSAAHFALGNYQRCAEDCTKALELLHPPVDLNLNARKQSFMRRGAALTKLGFLREAYGEFVAAIKLDPSDETLKNDADLLRAQMDAASSASSDDDE